MDEENIVLQSTTKHILALNTCRQKHHIEINKKAVVSITTAFRITTIYFNLVLQS